MRRAFLPAVALLLAAGCDRTNDRRSFAYVANQTGSVSVFAIDEQTGQLAATQTVASVDPRYLELHPSGRFLFVTQGDGTLSQ